MTIALILVKVTVTTLLALIAVRLAHRSRASVRHVLLTATFVVLMLLPVASWMAPTVRIPMPAAMQAAILPEVEEPSEESTPVAFAESTAGTRLPDQPQRPGMTWNQGLLGIWLAGVVFFLIPVIVGLWQVGRLRRSALPWLEGQSRVAAIAAEAGIRRRIQILLHESLPGPMTCGVIRPAIILPRDVQTWMADDVHRAIIHELEHVRRHDWLSQCLARTTAACYWFHPLVWVAWRQLALEAERACDDAVLRASEAEEYADQLVLLAQRLSTSRQPHLAMANRNDLATRVLAVLDGRQRRGRAGAACVAIVVGVGAVIVMTMSPLRIVAAVQDSRQGAASKWPTFDVVSIKPCESNAPGRPRSTSGTTPIASPGRLYLQCYTVFSILQQAYISFAEGRGHALTAALHVGIEGGPDWIRSERYTIEATTDQPAPSAVMRGPMMQAVLEDRFKLKIRRVTREMPVYELVIAESGAKVSPYTGTDCVIRDVAIWPPATLPDGQQYCGDRSRREGDRIIREGVMPLGELFSLTGFDYPVLNRTGITAPVRYRLDWPVDDRALGDAPSGPFLGAVRNQLGLELRLSKGPRDYLVIDSVERPAPNLSALEFAPPGRAPGPDR